VSIEQDLKTMKQALMDRYGYSSPGDEPWDALCRIKTEVERLRVVLGDEAARLERYADEIAGTDEEGLARSTASRLRQALETT
jgi:hypothetical protein